LPIDSEKHPDNSIFIIETYDNDKFVRYPVQEVMPGLKCMMHLLERSETVQQLLIF